MSTKITMPAIQYQQGGRTMYTAVMEPRALVKLVEEPRVWNPVRKDGADIGTNRALSQPHVSGITEYMERTLPGTDGQYVMDSVTLYGDEQALDFTPGPDARDSSPIKAGELAINFDARFHIGNGQHRITAHERIASSHPDPDDPVAVAHRAVGQPVVIVADQNPLHRALDFVTLQRNVKNLPGSLAESMDASQPLNAYLIDLCRAPDAPPVLGSSGDRLEFDKDILAKHGKQLLTYKAYRYISGTAMIGVDQRTTAGWKKAANASFEADPAWKGELKAMWRAWGQLPGIAEVLNGTTKPEDLREKSLVLVSAVTYACAYAIHLLKVNKGVSLADGVKRLATKVDFTRPERAPTEDKPLNKDETVFAGSLIDPVTGKVGSGRPAWEAAGNELYNIIRTA